MSDQPPETTAETASYLRGFAAALGSLQRQFDRPTMISSIMDGYGVTLADLESAGVEPYDLDPIRECMT